MKMNYILNIINLAVSRQNWTDWLACVLVSMYWSDGPGISQHQNFVCINLICCFFFENCLFTSELFSLVYAVTVFESDVAAAQQHWTDQSIDQ